MVAKATHKTKSSKSPTKVPPKKEKKEKKELCPTPPGMFSYPYFSHPDCEVRGDFKPDNKYKVDLIVDKGVWKTHPDAKRLKDLVLRTAQNKWGDDIESLQDFANPFKDTDKISNISEKIRGAVLIRAKSEFKPLIIGPAKNEDGEFDELSDKQVDNIKGGDWGRVFVAANAYTLNGTRGVNLYLNVVQYRQEGESLGDGKAASLKFVDEMEIEMDDLEASEEDSEEVEAPKKPGKKAKKVVEEEEEEEFEEEIEEEEEEEEAPKKSSKKPSKKSKSDDDDDDLF